jgi:hypothetical protein
MTRSFVRSPLWPWAKVVVLLVVLDWAVFRTGLFFQLVPRLERDPVTWGLVYRSVRVLDANARDPRPRAYVVGSSIVFLGLDENRIRAELAAKAVPTEFSSLTVFGAVGVDSALLAHAAARTRPWLVILTGSERDFPARGSLDTPVTRVFLDGSVDMPRLRPADVEGRLAAWVREHWLLYRYRFLVRMALEDALAPVASRAVALASASGVATVPPPTLVTALGPVPAGPPGAPPPEEAFQWFFPGRVTAESFAAWQRWRATRRFADYAEFLRLNRSGAIDQIGRQTLATYGPDDNVQVDALAWVTGELRRAGTRVIVLDFPENPVLRDPEALGVIDPALSDALASRLERDAQAHGARFVDLRNALVADDFYDLIHPNLEGSRKLSAMLADIVAEEWRAAGR